MNESYKILEGTVHPRAADGHSNGLLRNHLIYNMYPYQIISIVGLSLAFPDIYPYGVRCALHRGQALMPCFHSHAAQEVWKLSKAAIADIPPWSTPQSEAD